MNPITKIKQLKARQTQIRKVLAEDLDYIREELGKLEEEPSRIFRLQSFELYVSEGLTELQQIEDNIRRLKWIDSVELMEGESSKWN